MSAPVAERLWPMLVGVFVLLAGALALEFYAENASREPIVIHVGGAQGGDDDAGELLSARHDADAEVQKARNAGRRGAPKEALSILERALKARPKAPSLWGETGYWRLVSGDLAGAESALGKAIELDPQDPWTLYHAGLCRSRAGDPQGAAADWQKAIAVRPEYSAARLALANLWREAGRLPEALEIVRPATARGSNDEVARALATMGRILVSQGKRAEAELAFTKAIERAPMQVEVRLTAGKAYLTADDGKKALEVLNQAASLAPDLAEVHGALGRAHERLGDDGAAELAYERALRLDPSYRYGRRRLLRLLLERRDFAQARVHVQRLLTDVPNDPEHHFLAGLVASRDKKLDEARQHYHTAIARARGTYPEAFFNLGLLEKNASNFAAAEEAYKTAISQRPDYLPALSNLGLTYAAAGRPAEAEAVYKEALEQDPRYAPALLNLGQLMLDLRRYDDAARHFVAALEAKNGDYPEAQLNLATALARAGRRGDAISTYRAIVAVHPRYTSAWYNLGLTLEDEKHPAEAKVAFEKALEIDPAHPGSLRHYAALLAAAGDREAAHARYDEVLDFAPDDKGARLGLAELHLQGGDLAGCRREAERALATNPDDRQTQDLLRRCASASAAP